MAVTYESFLERFPEFTPHPSGIVNGAISEASFDASEDVFGEQTDRAVKFLSAHIIAIQLAQMGIQIGATEGKVYGEGLDATQYGQEFKRMLNTLPSSSVGFVV
jgi:hypothetical protein